MLAITNGTIIDGRGSDPLTGMTLLIENERIIALDRQDQVTIPRGTTVIDAMETADAPRTADQRTWSGRTSQGQDRLRAKGSGQPPLVGDCPLRECSWENTSKEHTSDD